MMKSFKSLCEYRSSFYGSVATMHTFRDTGIGGAVGAHPCAILIKGTVVMAHRSCDPFLSHLGIPS